MSYDADVASMHVEVFETFGTQGVLTTRDGESIPVVAVLDEVTHNVGDLAGLVDPRPSVQLMRSVAGKTPRGLLVLGERQFELDRPVDGDNDAHVVRVYVREITP
jgi:hypothetical protein